MKFGFVILHYLTTQDTIKCVRSIQKYVGNNNDIVIVDNHSSNGSLERLQHIFQDEARVYILTTSANIGFAKGNNIGYEFCRLTLNSQIIVCLNSDVELTQSDFKAIVTQSLDSDVGLIGPDIISAKDNTHQNPMSEYPFTKKHACLEIVRYSGLYTLNFFGLASIVRMINSHAHINQDSLVTTHEVSQRNRILHGSFLIFTPEFIRVNKYAFDPGTFLYLEENILYFRLRKQGLNSLYLPQIKVIHHEDSSTNASTSSIRSKKMFIAKNLIKSNLVLLRLLKEESLH